MRGPWSAALQGWRYACEHAASVHAAPLLLSTVLAVVVWCCGVHVLWCALLALCGAGGVLVLCWVQPLPSLAPAGGRHHVGLRELHADAARGLPPITAFYPTSEAPPPSRRHRVRWLPFDDTRYLRGLATYGRVPYVFVRDLRLVRVCASVDGAPMSLFDDVTGAPRPVFIFSHGLSAFARTYSTLLMNLASRGALVFAMTHMDGSAAFCRDAGEAVCVPFAAALPLTPAVREPQLRQRIAETRCTLAQLRSGALLRALHYSDDDVDRYLRASPTLTLMGHSFGGATVLAALAMHATAVGGDDGKDELCGGQCIVGGAGDAGDVDALPRVGAVVTFDPWHMPLEGDLFYSAICAGRARYTTPTLMLHSEEWVRYDDSWQFVHRLCHALATQTLPEREHARLSAAARRMCSEAKGVDDAGVGDKAATGWVSVHQCTSTGHRTCTDVALLSPVMFVPKYITAPSAMQMVRWAEQSLEFAQLHADAATA